MKSKTIIISMLLALLVGNVCAEDSIWNKLQNLRTSLRRYFVDAPKPTMVQRLRIHGIIQLHRLEIRPEAEKLRSLVIAAKQQMREELTREQLLTAMTIHDEFSYRRPGAKMALLLRKMEAPDRVQLLQLLRRIKNGNGNKIEQNIDALRVFFQEKLRPQLLEKLALTQDQQSKLKEIAMVERQKIRPLLVSLIQKLYRLRDEIKHVLTKEQHAYIEANRDKIFQEILDFAAGL